jgi:membrane protease YdiL (CAAX protease family)
VLAPLRSVSTAGLCESRIARGTIGWKARAVAIVDVALVYGATFALIALVARSQLSQWEAAHLGRPFVANAVMLVVPLAIVLGLRRDRCAYGLVAAPLRYHLDVIRRCAIPVAVAGAATMLADPKTPAGAAVETAVSMGLLFVLARLLRDRPPVAMLAVIPLALGLGISDFAMGRAVSAFTFFLFFVGPAEEMLFRGYIQSRLNQAFGRPYEFAGARWGLAVWITALLFGLMHLLNLSSLLRDGTWDPQVWWGAWTMVGSLVYSYVRERTGSILAPAVLHGFPQAIAYPVLGL